MKTLSLVPLKNGQNKFLILKSKTQKKRHNYIVPFFCALIIDMTNLSLGYNQLKISLTLTILPLKLSILYQSNQAFYLLVNRFRHLLNVQI